jgi:glycerol-3-phosphate O-acyltransferase
LNKIYVWIDLIWQWIAETVFVRFDFDLPVEHLKEIAQHSRLTFAMTHVGIIEYLIISSWCRSQGLGAILIANRKRILFISKPKYFFQVLFRRRTYANLFLSDEQGPRLLFCPSSERKRLFEPIPVERLLGDIYSLPVSGKESPKFHFVPLFILWRKHVRGASRTLSEYLLGMTSNPNLIGKLWFLLRARKDSLVRALPDFPMVAHSEGTDSWEEPEAMRLAKSTRRKIIVLESQEMRVILGPRYTSPHSVKETLLKDPDIQRVIDEVAAQTNTDKRKVMSRAYKNLTEIVAKYRFRTIEILFVFLTWLFTRVFDGVVVQEEELQRVREVMKTKPVVFVPCHRSHLDYLVIPYILFLHDMVTPHIAAGINLSFWPVGVVLRSGGAFFIRRSFRGDPLYGICLKKYVEYLLRNKYIVKFFIEGTRSRSGKMLAPAYGILKMVIETQRHGVCEDVALIPVSLCYDEVPEQGAYTKELSGGNKVKESTSQLIKSSEIIKRNFGKVYVRFAPPLSVRELDKGGNQDPTLLLQKMAFQLCKSINDVTPITPKSIVSSVFLGHRLAGVSLEELLRLSMMLGTYVKASGFPLSVDLNEAFKRAVEQTVRRLSKSSVLTVSDSVPRAYSCDWRKRILLNFYKNNAIQCFIIPSITLLAFFEALDGLAATDKGSTVRDRLLQTVVELRNILKFEFFFSPKAQFVKEIDFNLDYFFGSRFWEEKTVGELVTTLSNHFRHWDDVSLYLRLLGELVESYLTVLYFVRDAGEGATNLDKKALSQKIVKFGEARDSESQVVFPESISALNYSNALLFLENQKHLKQVTTGEKKNIELGQWDENLEKTRIKLEKFIWLMEENIGASLIKMGLLPSEGGPSLLSLDQKKQPRI